ncbi:MAG TPA: hypothetical protein VHA53_06345, partial [Nitrolancea sp.]|nr:hypothetical protein [Nitrolancea sp.]
MSTPIPRAIAAIALAGAAIGLGGCVSDGYYGGVGYAGGYYDSPYGYYGGPGYYGDGYGYGWYDDYWYPGTG